MFSLRRIPVRSCKINSLIPRYIPRQGQIALRTVESIAIDSGKTAGPSASVAIQRRNFGGDGRESYTRQPGGFGVEDENSDTDKLYQEHRGLDGKPLKPTSVLYVGNVQFDVTEDALRQHFEAVAPVKNVRIIHDVRGMSKGFGYIDFGDTVPATKAAQALNNSIFAGRRLNVQFLANPTGTKAEPNPPSKTLFIGNMNYDMTDDDINELFRDIQQCVDIRVAMDRRTGKPRGFAHADFASVEAAVAAKQKLEGRLFFGRALRVDYSARERDDDGKLLPAGASPV